MFIGQAVCNLMKHNSVLFLFLLARLICFNGPPNQLNSPSRTVTFFFRNLYIGVIQILEANLSLVASDEEYKKASIMIHLYT